MKEGDYEGDYLGSWRGPAAGLQKPPPRARTDSGKLAGVGGHSASHLVGLQAQREVPATSRSVWAQPRHCLE